MTQYRIGTFRVTGKLVAGDPCYREIGQGLRHELDALPGEWIAYVEISNEGQWGHRVAELLVHHEDHIAPATNEVDALGVDSGQMAFLDECETNPADWDAWYEHVCSLTLDTEHQAGIVHCCGVASSSGYGDGVYALLTRTKDGKIVAASVNFMEYAYDEEEK